MSDSFRDRLIEVMNIREVKAAELAKRTGLSKAQISQYTNGVYEAKQVALYKLAVALDVSEAWLMGHNVPMERLLHQRCATESDLFDKIDCVFGKEAGKLMEYFVQLNSEGKGKAVDTLEDLTAIEKYTEKKGK